VLVARSFTFEAAHRLPDHPGRCRDLHGHGYRVVVVCDAGVDPASGLAIDFGDVKKVVRERAIDVLDHSYLNDRIAVPSAENIAVWIWRQLEGSLPLHEVRVHETADCFVTYRGEDPARPTFASDAG
jgi:6-pyruvoyltetrahydropterin/6-carboxytetrahydropterin synthase